jgi:type IV pilus assembly protein PilC
MAGNKRYSYSARDLSGAIQSGTMLATSETDVGRRLQSMGLAPISVRTESNVLKRSIGPAKRTKPKHLAEFARQFATMTEAGLPMIRTLSALMEQTDHPEMQRVLPLIKAEIEAGAPLSGAMAKHPRVFPPLMSGMVAAGEASGALALTMRRVAENYEKEAKLRAKVFSAMLYPTIVLVIALLMVIGMLIFIVPTFAEVFGSLGGELPLPTRLLVFASNVMKFTFPFLAGAVVLLLVWWGRHKNDERTRNIIDPFKLRFPILGKFARKIALARFSRTFAALLQSGIPMLQAIDMVKTTSGNSVLAQSLSNVQDAVRSGRPLAGPMMQEPIFTSLVTQMIATGEETGTVPEMLERVADYYDNEVETTANSLTSIIEPIMIVGLASIVAAMVVAMYLPMFQVFELIQ